MANHENTRTTDSQQSNPNAAAWGWTDDSDWSSGDQNPEMPEPWQLISEGYDPLKVIDDERQRLWEGQYISGYASTDVGEYGRAFNSMTPKQTTDLELMNSEVDVSANMITGKGEGFWKANRIRRTAGRLGIQIARAQNKYSNDSLSERKRERAKAKRNRLVQRYRDLSTRARQEAERR
jgi:hypothetical protein